MLSLIRGGQGDGKTYFVVSEIIVPTLREQRSRHVYHNLPLVVAGEDGHTGKDICDFAFPRNPNAAARARARLHRVPDEFLHMFWRYNYVTGTAGERDGIEPNSVICLDELYEHFNARDWESKEKNAAMKAVQRELLSFTRQHRHGMHDLYLISHCAHDIDKIVRTGAQQHIELRNSRKLTISADLFPRGGWGRIMMGDARYPVQFFRVKWFDRADFTTAVAQANIFPKKAIFGLYNSFSTTAAIPGQKVAAVDECESSDMNQGLVKRWAGVVQGAMFMAFFLTLGVFAFWGAIDIVKGIGEGVAGNSSLKPAKQEAKAIDQVPAEAVAPGVAAPAVHQVAHQEKKIPKVSVITSRSVTFDTGLQIRVGDRVSPTGYVTAIKREGLWIEHGGRVSSGHLVPWGDHQ